MTCLAESVLSEQAIKMKNYPISQPGARNRTWTFNIVEVLVVAVLTQAGFRPVAPEAFFSVEEVDERVAFISPYGF
jgi:hypothetical protein